MHDFYWMLLLPQPVSSYIINDKKSITIRHFLITGNNGVTGYIIVTYRKRGRYESN